MNCISSDLTGISRSRPTVMRRIKYRFFTFGVLAACSMQAAAQPSEPLPAFDVAAIRLHEPAPHERQHIVSSDKSGSFMTQNVSLLAIMQYAFMIPDSRIVNVPPWVKDQRFDIQAKSNDVVNERLSKLEWDQATPLKHAMIQALLADRFKLVVHRETRVLPVYELVVSKGGAKLTAAKTEGMLINHGPGRLEAQGMTVAGMAQELAPDVGRVIVDKTGLNGQFDINLKWTPDDTVNPAADAPPSVFTALEEQYGLKLVAAKGPVEVLVIDHVEQPSAN
jgi:uncharacterized protein (TIGR03435 family)